MFKPVEAHECTANCLPKIPVKNIDEQLAYLKSFRNPYIVPMVVFNFKRVIIQIKANLKIQNSENGTRKTPELRLTYVTPCGKVLFNLVHVKGFLAKARSPANYYLKEYFFTYSFQLQLQNDTVEVN